MVPMLRRWLFPPVAVLAWVLTLSAQPPNLDKIGPAVGSIVPAFSGVDQFGRTHTLQSIVGAEGAMLVFFRSADW
jgi:hypothetical protein